MLADAFPSPPGRPGKYVLYIGRVGDELGYLTEVHIWATAYGALKFLELVLDEDDFVMLTDRKLRTEHGVTVECTLLKEVIEHDYTVAEAIWQMPEPHRSMARRLRGNVDVEAAIGVLERRAAGMSEEREAKRARKASGVKRSKPGGYVDIGVIAQELSMEPREARGILRAKVKKPDVGWAWKPEDVDGIKEILRKGKKG